MLDMRDTLDKCNPFLYNKFKNLRPPIPSNYATDVIWLKNYCYDGTFNVKWTPTNIYDLFNFSTFYHPIPSISYPHWLHAHGRKFGKIYTNQCFMYKL